MRHAVGWVWVVLSCFLAGAATAEEPELDSLARLYMKQGRYEEAAPLLRRALTLREARHGKHHPEVAAALNALGALYLEQSLYRQAEPLYLRALAIQEEALGRDHPKVATTLNALASVYKWQGFHGQAEPLFQRALAIREASYGQDHPMVATPLRNLADIHAAQGEYARAERLYQRARAINEAASHRDAYEDGINLYCLADLYLAQGLYDQAEPLYQRTLALWEESRGVNHPDVARPLNSLANLHVHRESYLQAELLLQRALAIREAAFGKDNADVAQTLLSLANLYTEQGLYGWAEPLFQRALTIQQSALGDNHPDVVVTLNALARLHLSQRRLDEALPLFTRAFASSEQRLRQEALDFSESRLARFLQLLREDEQVLHALARAHPEDARVRRLTLGAVLLRKGRSVAETAGISRTLYERLGAEDRDAFKRLRELRTQRTTLAFMGPGALPPRDHQRRLEVLANEGDALEADLAQRSAPLRALTQLPLPDEIVDRVAAALPRDGVLVELVTYRDRPLVPSPGTPRAKEAAPLRYLVLVLLPDASTRALDLGPAAPIDRAATHLRDALAHRDADFQLAAQALHQLVFQPLLPLLGTTRRLFLAPDGQLSLVPFAALHDGRRFLLDSFDFTYLTSGKDLLPRPRERAPTSSVVVLADPDFHARVMDNGALQASRSAALERFFSTSRADFSATSWAPLPGSRQEAEGIKRLLPQAQVFLGAEATKQRLLHLPTPGILHLATHGFFLDDAAGPEGARAVVQLGELADDGPTSPPPDPLLRSGLILAGASPEATGGSDAAGPPPDAVVTALELAGLDLWGTQLVVLSACDTGRGDVKPGQGVAGLRRAFLVAGAETVVMSLWKVNDATTRSLMEAYYRHLLAGQGRATALREAMRELRQTRAHPHYWAPFIAVGSDAPLRTLVPDASPRPVR